MIQVHVALNNTIKTYTFPDDTTFEMNTPLHGFLRVMPNEEIHRSWWFNTAYVIAVAPDTTVLR